MNLQMCLQTRLVCRMVGLGFEGCGTYLQMARLNLQTVGFRKTESADVSSLCVYLQTCKLSLQTV